MSIPSRVLSAGSSPLLSSVICGDGATAVAGAGSTQATATQLSAVFNNVSTNPASGGVKLQPCEEGAVVFVYNTDSDTVTVYPYETSGVTINGSSSTTVAQNKTRIFFATSATTWMSMLGA